MKTNDETPECIRHVGVADNSTDGLQAVETRGIIVPGVSGTRLWLITQVLRVLRQHICCLVNKSGAKNRLSRQASHVADDVRHG